MSIKDMIIKVTNGETILSMKHTMVADMLLLFHTDISIIDSSTMLRMIIDRICDENVMMHARIRGVQMCTRWMNNYWKDFQSNEQMMDIMEGFIGDISSSKSKLSKLTNNDIKLLMRIKTTFEKKSQEYEVEKKKKIAEANRKLLDNVEIPKNYDIMQESAESIAQQLTLMDFSLFKSIAKREMCGMAWKKKDRDERAPNLLATINRFNQLGKFVQCTVLQQRNKKKRAKSIEKFIRVAVCLKDLRNFTACNAIHMGLTSVVVYRLKETWKLVGKQELKQYEEIKSIFSHQKNFELLRIIHRNAHAPSVPYIGLFLSDIVQIDEELRNMNENGTVNFIKLKRMYELFGQISMYQSSSYSFDTNDMMQSYITKVWKKQELYDETKLYTVSTIVKKKDAEGKDINDDDLDW